MNEVVYFVTLSGSEGPRFFAMLRMTGSGGFRMTDGVAKQL